jgi:hypothetical protein
MKTAANILIILATLAAVAFVFVLRTIMHGQGLMRNDPYYQQKR